MSTGRRRQARRVFDRETLPDGSTLLRSARCRFTLTRLRPGAFLVRIEGYDQGEFGDAPFDAILAEMTRFGPLELFVDTADALGAATPVREAWTEWFRVQQPRLRRAHLLGGSKYMTSTLNIAKELSRTGELIRVHAGRESFDAALAQARTAAPTPRDTGRARCAGRHVRSGGARTVDAASSRFTPRGSRPKSSPAWPGPTRGGAGPWMLVRRHGAARGEVHPVVRRRSVAPRGTSSVPGIGGAGAESRSAWGSTTATTAFDLRDWTQTRRRIAAGVRTCAGNDGIRRRAITLVFRRYDGMHGSWLIVRTGAPARPRVHSIIS